MICENDSNKSLEDLMEERNNEELIRRFEPFLQKYRQIFNPDIHTRGIINMANRSYDISRALKAMTHSNTEEQIHCMRQHVNSVLSKEDTDQIVYLCFLECLDKFDPDRGVPLQKFIYYYYPYVFRNEIMALTTTRQKLNQPSVGGDIGEAFLNKSIGSAHRDHYDDIDIDLYWVEGECGEIFKCLTPLERKILISIFLERKTYVEIANELRLHESSIKRRKKEIMTKLERAIREERELE